MPEYSELLQKRRSIRDFQEREVSLDLVMEILRESCLAPSSGNGQPWRFILVLHRGWIKRLSDESKRDLLVHREKNPDSPLKKYEGALRNENYNVFYNAPCLVLFVGPKEVRSIKVDRALAASYFMFSAAARGLGTCWVDLGSEIHDPGLLREIGMTVGYRIVAPLILGYPKSIPPPPHRNQPQILKVLS